LKDFLITFKTVPLLCESAYLFTKPLDEKKFYKLKNELNILVWEHITCFHGLFDLVVAYTWYHYCFHGLFDLVVAYNLFGSL
jgi:hypothetical protein